MRLHDAVDQDELAEIEARWGTASRLYQPLTVDHPFLTGEHQELVKDRRRAEICYVMHRGNPADGLLLHIKTIYPTGAFRLPTGGIHQGEAVVETLAREIWEETGLTVGSGPNQVQVQRYLGVVVYDLIHRSLARTFAFATYHFLVQAPPDAVLQPQDADEMIGGWKWIVADRLAEVAANLDRVGERAPVWADWGRYRALSHRFVYGALQQFADSRPATL